MTRTHPATAAMRVRHRLQAAALVPMELQARRAPAREMRALRFGFAPVDNRAASGTLPVLRTAGLGLGSWHIVR